MSPYVFALLLGAIGLAAMAVGGVGGHHWHFGSHVARAGGSGHLAHGQSARGHAPALPGVRSSRASGWLGNLLSPRVLFSVLVGFGATGTVMSQRVSAPVALGCAVAGGLLFEVALIRPIWNSLLRFESSPAQTLASALLEPAQAITSFDANGQGLVALELNGQVVQLLGTLTLEDRESGDRVRAGDRLTVEAVDEARNQCTVSRAHH